MDNLKSLRELELIGRNSSPKLRGKKVGSIPTLTTSLELGKDSRAVGLEAAIVPSQRSCDEPR